MTTAAERPYAERPSNMLLNVLRTDLCQTPEDLERITGLSRHTIVKAMGLLIRSGMAARREVGCYVISSEGDAFRASGGVIKDGPKGRHTSAAPKRMRKVTGRDKTWSAMRMKRKFTLDELLTLSGDTVQNAYRYIRILAKHGYLIEMSRREAGTAVTSPGFKRWLLVRDTGPLAPAWSPAKGGLFDRNLGHVVTP